MTPKKHEEKLFKGTSKMFPNWKGRDEEEDPEKDGE